MLQVGGKDHKALLKFVEPVKGKSPLNGPTIPAHTIQITPEEFPFATDGYSFLKIHMLSGLEAGKCFDPKSLNYNNKMTAMPIDQVIPRNVVQVYLNKIEVMQIISTLKFGIKENKNCFLVLSGGVLQVKNAAKELLTPDICIEAFKSYDFNERPSTITWQARYVLKCLQAVDGYDKVCLSFAKDKPHYHALTMSSGNRQAGLMPWRSLR